MEEDTKSIGQLNGPWSMLFKIMLITIVPFCGWMSIAIISNQISIAEIKASRFTSQDGKDVWQELNQKYDKRRDTLPPQWLRDEILEIKEDIKTIAARIRNLENKSP